MDHRPPLRKTYKNSLVKTTLKFYLILPLPTNYVQLDNE